MKLASKKWALTGLIILVLLIGWSINTDATVPDSLKTNVSSEKSSGDPCASCAYHTGCSEGISNGSDLPFSLYWPLAIVIAGILLLLVFKRFSGRNILWIVASTIFVFAVYARINLDQEHATEEKVLCATTTSSQTDEFAPLTSAETDSFAPLNTPTENSVSEADEFAPLSASETTDKADDEFAPIEENNSSEALVVEKENHLSKGETDHLLRIILALSLTVLAGLMVQKAGSRRFRIFFMLSSLVFLGFATGGCPCMISSFQNVILSLFGESTNWISWIWFLGLIPISYFFGRIWCGWVCHLGAFQDFIYRPSFAFLQSPKAQKWLQRLQILTLVVLIAQLAITKTNIFIHYDPFKVAFNLFSANVTGYILLAILLVSSLLVYRPFCRGFCPIGLILGWVSLIPGASKLQIESSCTSCKRCDKTCDNRSIACTSEGTKIDNTQCIRCGNCFDSCKKESIRRTGVSFQK